MNIEEKKELRLKIKEEALSWIGTPYAHAQSVKGAGADCGLILLRIYANLGFLDYKKVRTEIGYYPSDWAFHQDEPRYLNQILRFCNEVKGQVPQTGDIILYNWGKVPSHGAIVIDYPIIVHAFMPHKCVCLDKADRLFLKNKVYGIFRLKELI